MNSAFLLLALLYDMVFRSPEVATVKTVRRRRPRKPKVKAIDIATLTGPSTSTARVEKILSDAFRTRKLVQQKKTTGLNDLNIHEALPDDYDLVTFKMIPSLTLVQSLVHYTLLLAYNDKLCGHVFSDVVKCFAPYVNENIARRCNEKKTITDVVNWITTSIDGVQCNPMLPAKTTAERVKVYCQRSGINFLERKSIVQPILLTHFDGSNNHWKLSFNLFNGYTKPHFNPYQFQLEQGTRITLARGIFIKYFFLPALQSRDVQQTFKDTLNYTSVNQMNTAVNYVMDARGF